MAVFLQDMLNLLALTSKEVFQGALEDLGFGGRFGGSEGLRGSEHSRAGWHRGEGGALSLSLWIHGKGCFSEA